MPRLAWDGGHLGLDLDGVAGGLDPARDVGPRVIPAPHLPLREQAVGDGEVVVPLDVVRVERDRPGRQADAGREVRHRIGPALELLLPQAPEDPGLAHQHGGQAGIDPQRPVAGREGLLDPGLRHVRQGDGRLELVLPAPAVLGVQVGIARPAGDQPGVDVAGAAEETEGLFVSTRADRLGALVAVDLGFELGRLGRRGVPAGRRQSVGVAPIVEGDQPGERGGARRARERLAQIAQGGIAVGALGFLPPGVPFRAGGDAVGVRQRPLVGPAEGEAQRLGHVRTALAGRPGPLQVRARQIFLVQNQIPLAEGEVPRPGGERADLLHLGADRIHLRPQLPLVRGDVVERLGGYVLHAGLERADPLAELLGELSPLARLPLGAQAQGSHQRQGEDGGDRDGGQRPILAQPLARPVDPARRAGADRLAVEETVEILGEVAGRFVAPGGVLLQALGDDGLEVLGGRRHHLTQRFRLFLDELDQDAGEVGAGERGLAREQLVEDDAEAVDVRPPVERLPLRRLWRDVARGAADHAGAGEGDLVLGHGEAEVDDVGVDLAPLVAGEQDVARLEVAVDEPGAVGGVDGAGGVAHELDLVGERQLVAQLAQAAPLDVLHGDVRPPLGLADLVDLADVGVGDPRLGPRLAQEALGLRGIVAVEELERHPAVEGRIERLVDRAHAAGSQVALDTVARPVGQEAELRGEGRGWGRAAGGGNGRPGPRLAGEVRGTVVPVPLNLGGQALDVLGGQQPRLDERPHPAAVETGHATAPALGRQVLGDRVEVLPAEQALGDRQPQETALHGWAHGGLVVSCETGMSLSGLGGRARGGTRTTRTYTDAHGLTRTPGTKKPLFVLVRPCRSV